ncbi:hypothetical protein B0J12DRAFT_705043 [Macrophomina phaseolina]|uniref:Uncharacterized protein n=1 Tax=Macrophomina phaseolina TaxID=35725 RepID=A0ABQ8FTL5_9PEZI|nr:hypothetical protein B0J12DRAFT_705043 [Macrophomina phaseolina]
MPLSALFILFDFVVHNPMHPETINNLALLDVAGGHSSNIEYVSRATLPASICVEFAHIARQYVQDFRLRHQKMGDSAARPTDEQAVTMPTVAPESATIPNPTSTGEDLWKVAEVTGFAEGLGGDQSAPPHTGQEASSLPSNLGLEYIDPVFFLLGDDSVSATADSGLGIDIMDLFDVNLSDILALGT